MYYDDACRLRRFIENRRDMQISGQNRLENISNIDFVVDKLHIQGHTEKWCHENFHPKLFPELDRVNTVVCEQINFWLRPYKHIMKYMNEIRFNFYLYFILNEYNKIKLYGRYELIYLNTKPKTSQCKRKHDELSDDEEI